MESEENEDTEELERPADHVASEPTQSLSPPPGPSSLPFFSPPQPRPLVAISNANENPPVTIHSPRSLTTKPAVAHPPSTTTNISCPNAPPSSVGSGLVATGNRQRVANQSIFQIPLSQDILAGSHDILAGSHDLSLGLGGSQSQGESSQSLPPGPPPDSLGYDFTTPDTQAFISNDDRRRAEEAAKREERAAETQEESGSSSHSDTQEVVEPEPTDTDNVMQAVTPSNELIERTDRHYRRLRDKLMGVPVVPGGESSRSSDEGQAASLRAAVQRMEQRVISGVPESNLTTHRKAPSPPGNQVLPATASEGSLSEARVPVQPKKPVPLVGMLNQQSTVAVTVAPSSSPENQNRDEEEETTSSPSEDPDNTPTPQLKLGPPSWGAETDASTEYGTQTTTSSWSGKNTSGSSSSGSLSVGPSFSDSQSVSQTEHIGSTPPEEGIAILPRFHQPFKVPGIRKRISEESITTNTTTSSSTTSGEVGKIRGVTTLSSQRTQDQSLSSLEIPLAPQSQTLESSASGCTLDRVQVPSSLPDDDETQPLDDELPPSPPPPPCRVLQSLDQESQDLATEEPAWYATLKVAPPTDQATTPTFAEEQVNSGQSADSAITPPTKKRKRAESSSSDELPKWQKLDHNRPFPQTRTPSDPPPELRPSPSSQPDLNSSLKSKDGSFSSSGLTQSSTDSSAGPKSSSCETPPSSSDGSYPGSGSSGSGTSRSGGSNQGSNSAPPTSSDHSYSASGSCDSGANHSEGSNGKSSPVPPSSGSVDHRGQMAGTCSSQEQESSLSQQPSSSQQTSKSPGTQNSMEVIEICSSVEEHSSSLVRDALDSSVGEIDGDKSASLLGDEDKSASLFGDGDKSASLLGDGDKSASLLGDGDKSASLLGDGDKSASILGDGDRSASLLGDRGDDDDNTLTLEVQSPMVIDLTESQPSIQPESGPTNNRPANTVHDHIKFSPDPPCTPPSVVERGLAMSKVGILTPSVCGEEGDGLPQADEPMDTDATSQNSFCLRLSPSQSHPITQDSQHSRSTSIADSCSRKDDATAIKESSNVSVVPNVESGVVQLSSVSVPIGTAADSSVGPLYESVPTESFSESLLSSGKSGVGKSPSPQAGRRTVVEGSSLQPTPSPNGTCFRLKLPTDSLIEPLSSITPPSQPCQKSSTPSLSPLPSTSTAQKDSCKLPAVSVAIATSPQLVSDSDSVMSSCKITRGSDTDTSFALHLDTNTSESSLVFMTTASEAANKLSTSDSEQATPTIVVAEGVSSDQEPSAEHQRSTPGKTPHKSLSLRTRRTPRRTCTREGKSDTDHTSGFVIGVQTMEGEVGQSLSPDSQIPPINVPRDSQFESSESSDLPFHISLPKDPESFRASCTVPGPAAAAPKAMPKSLFFGFQSSMTSRTAGRPLPTGEEGTSSEGLEGVFTAALRDPYEFNSQSQECEVQFVRPRRQRNKPAAPVDSMDTCDRGSQAVGGDDVAMATGSSSQNGDTERGVDTTTPSGGDDQAVDVCLHGDEDSTSMRREFNITRCSPGHLVVEESQPTEGEMAQHEPHSLNSQSQSHSSTSSQRSHTQSSSSQFHRIPSPVTTQTLTTPTNSQPLAAPPAPLPPPVTAQALTTPTNSQPLATPPVPLGAHSTTFQSPLPSTPPVEFTSPSAMITPQGLEELKRQVRRDGVSCYELRHVRTVRTLIEQRIVSSEVVENNQVVQGTSRIWQEHCEPKVLQEVKVELAPQTSLSSSFNFPRSPPALTTTTIIHNAGPSMNIINSPMTLVESPVPPTSKRGVNERDGRAVTPSAGHRGNRPPVRRVHPFHSFSNSEEATPTSPVRSDHSCEESEGNSHPLPEPAASSDPQPQPSDRAKSKKTVSPAAPEKITAASGEGEPSPLIVGSKVIAKWKDKCWYMATITAEGKQGRKRVEYADGDTGTVATSNLLHIDSLRTGVPVSVIPLLPEDSQSSPDPLQPSIKTNGLFEGFLDETHGTFHLRCGEEVREYSSACLCVQTESIKMCSEDRPSPVTAVTNVTNRKRKRQSDGGPTSSKKKKLSTPPAGVQMQLFKGYLFTLTQRPMKDESELASPKVTGVNKEHMAQQICSRGGRVAETIMAHQVVGGQTFVLSDNFCKTRKFLLGLAMEVPCVAYAWISDSIEQGRVLDFTNYRLPVGVDNSGTIVTWSLKHRSCLLGGLSIHLIGIESFKTHWTEIVEACGARLVQKLPTSTARSYSRNTGALSVVCERLDLVSRSLLHQAKSNPHTLHLVTPNWIVQSLVQGQLLSSDEFSII